MCLLISSYFNINSNPKPSVRRKLHMTVVHSFFRSHTNVQHCISGHMVNQYWVISWRNRKKKENKWLMVYVFFWSGCLGPTTKAVTLIVTSKCSFSRLHAPAKLCGRAVPTRRDPLLSSLNYFMRICQAFVYHISYNYKI